MITPNLNTDGCTGNILIEPNHPTSWRDNINFIKIFSLLSLVIGIIFTYQGFLLVLPFSGLEILVLAISLYIVYKHYNTCQVIYFTDDSVIIESGNQHADERTRYQRYWSQFHIDDPGPYSIPRLTIRSKGKSTEIGHFLSLHDKIELIKLIKELTIHFQLNHKPH